MNEQTKIALLSSIDHWKDYENGEEERFPTASLCALCSLFYDKNCNGCPVILKTNKQICLETPYIDAANAYRMHGPKSPEFKAAAKLEREFLESLLP